MGGEIMEFDYSKLRGKIKEVFGTQDQFALKMKMGRVSLSQRLNNALQFSQREIERACNLLGIPPEEISVYFFTAKVQKREQNYLDSTYRKETQ